MMLHQALDERALIRTIRAGAMISLIPAVPILAWVIVNNAWSDAHLALATGIALVASAVLFNRKNRAAAAIVGGFAGIIGGQMLLTAFPMLHTIAEIEDWDKKAAAFVSLTILLAVFAVYALFVIRGAKAVFQWHQRFVR